MDISSRYFGFFSLLDVRSGQPERTSVIFIYSVLKNAGQQSRLPDPILDLFLGGQLSHKGFLKVDLLELLE